MIVFTICMLIGAMASALTGYFFTSLAVQGAIDSLQVRAYDYTLDCSQNYSPKAFTVTLNGENTYCTLKEIRQDLNSYKLPEAV